MGVSSIKGGIFPLIEVDIQEKAVIDMSFGQKISWGGVPMFLSTV